MTGRLVSFDVWDTLLRRRCDPEAVKLFTCRSLLLLHAPVVEPGWHDAWKLLWHRHRIERQLARSARREGHDGEYTLSDVLLGLLRRCVRDGTSEGTLQAMAARLHRAELSQELFVAYADPGIAAIVADNAGAQMGFLSDFHLPTEDVARLLTHNGFAGIAGRGLVSGDVKLSKRSGRLYQYARRAWSIGASDWLHVGDDRVADVVMARRAGVRAFLYAPEDEQTERRRKAHLLGRPHLVLEDACRSIAERAVSEAEATDDRNAAWRLLGARSAPLLAGFALWCLEEALAGDIDRIELAGRQGGFLARVYQEVGSCFADAWPVPAGAFVRSAGVAHADGNGRAAIVDLLGDTEVGGTAMPDSNAVSRRLSLLGPTDAYLPEPGDDRDDRRLEALLALCSEPTDGAAACVVPWQQGALEATATLVRELRTHVITSDDLRPFALNAWREPLDAAARQMSLPVGARVASGSRTQGQKQAISPTTRHPGLWRHAVPVAIRAVRRLRAVRNRLKRMRRADRHS